MPVDAARRSPAPLAALTLALVAVLAVVGGTADAAPMRSPATPPAAAAVPRVGATSGDGEGEPTAAEVAASRRAAALRARAVTQAGAVADARTSMARASRLAALALEEHRAAVQAREAAERTAAADAARLATARRALTASRHAMGRWARHAYLDGGSVGDSPGLSALLEGRPLEDAGLTDAAVGRVGGSRTEVLDELRGAEAAQARASARSRASLTSARTAAAAADRTRRTRDTPVERQRRLLARLQAGLDRADEAAGDATRRAANLRRARRAAAAAGARDTNCPGRDLSGFANGRIPTSALCPVFGARGHRLRADAAAAFNRMSRAFAERFGRPICVTDSYRSYAAQVSVKRRKPGLAATPGTSNHGWGTAGDLCGGVQRFGSPEHGWLDLHASAYRWFHPSWAEPDGSKPEPWHWEYGA